VSAAGVSWRRILADGFVSFPLSLMLSKPSLLVSLEGLLFPTASLFSPLSLMLSRPSLLVFAAACS
jgi:hypothetical protein